MRPLKGIEGGAQGGLDPRRARLARVHDAAILGMAGAAVGFFVVGFLLMAGQWEGAVVFWARLALATLAMVGIMCVATVYMVAFMFDADPRTRRERRDLPAEES